MTHLCMQLRGMKVWLAILCALLAGGSSLAYSTDPASLAGRVVKDPGGEPLKKAIIELIQDTAGESAHNYTATSDSEGSFSISNITPGLYHLLIERTGYLFVDAKHHRSDSTTLSFEQGQSLTDQIFHMLPCAVVTGRVLDEDGDPMPEAFVALLHRVPSSDRLDQVAGERTNDVGQYRLSGIMPGRYYLAVTPAPDITNFLAPHKKEAKADLAYVPTFYPNALDRAQASVLELRPGDEVPIDFSLARMQTARIRGVIAGVPDGAHAWALLHSADGSQTFNQVEADKDGKFEMRDVAPGTYDLLAIETLDDKTRIARQTEQIAGASVEGVRLTPLPGASIRGQVRVDGPPVDLSQFALTLNPSGPDSWITMISATGSGHVHPDGTFEWKDLAPGNYTLQVTSGQTSTSDYFLESVNAGGRDTRDTGLTVNTGSILLDVVLSAKGAKLTGVVVDEKGQPVANAVVVAMPEEKFRKRSERYAKATTDQRGQFSMQGLIPGQYSLLAWESLDGDSYLDADFRKQFEDQAVSVRAESSQSAKVTLKAQPAPDDQPQ
jgi:protocatechuate 3,4-dioxygenase beta subunit